MTAELDWNVAGDAELAGAAATGDPAALAGIYDRYADRLYDFCMGMVGDRDAADCVQEAFCMAAVDLPTLRDPNKLRPWLYAIARHQALRTLRARQRETTSDELPDKPSAEAGPDALAARNELAALVAQAEGGISDRDREVLDLAYRHGLTGAELAQALGVSSDSAKKMVQRLRDTVERSLGALLVTRQASGAPRRCTGVHPRPQLAARAHSHRNAACPSRHHRCRRDGCARSWSRCCPSPNGDRPIRSVGRCNRRRSSGNAGRDSRLGGPAQCAGHCGPRYPCRAHRLDIAGAEYFRT